MNNATSIQARIRARAGEKGVLACRAAHLIASELDADPLSVGEQATAADVRIVRCQLGLFGYAEEKGMPGYRIVRKLEQVPGAAAAAVCQALKEGEISCATLWNIGQAHGISKIEMGNIAQTLEAKVRQCQLGCF